MKKLIDAIEKRRPGTIPFREEFRLLQPIENAIGEAQLALPPPTMPDIDLDLAAQMDRHLAQLALEKDAELRGYASDSDVSVSGYETDWTERMGDRIDDLGLETIPEYDYYSEEAEAEHILPVVDPDWQGSPTKRTVEEHKDEMGNWSLTMFGVAFVFLAIASYMD